MSGNRNWKIVQGHLVEAGYPNASQLNQQQVKTIASDMVKDALFRERVKIVMIGNRVFLEPLKGWKPAGD